MRTCTAGKHEVVEVARKKVNEQGACKCCPVILRRLHSPTTVVKLNVKLK